MEQPETLENGNPSKTVSYQFQPGNQIGKLGGRPKGSRSFMKEFELCYRKVERKRGRRFMEHAIDRAWENDKLIPPILDRVVPVQRTPETQERPVLIVAGAGSVVQVAPQVLVNGH